MEVPLKPLFKHAIILNNLPCPMRIILKNNDVIYTRSRMKLSYLKAKPHGVQSIRYLIARATGTCFYHLPGSDNNKLLRLDKLHRPTHHQANLCDKPNTKMNYIMCFIMIMWGKVYHVFFINHAGKNTSRYNDYVQPD